MGISRLLLLFSLSVTPLLAQVPAEAPPARKHRSLTKKPSTMFTNTERTLPWTTSRKPTSRTMPPKPSLRNM
jgi:hypothetical protein